MIIFISIILGNPSNLIQNDSNININLYSNPSIEKMENLGLKY